MEREGQHEERQDSVDECECTLAHDKAADGVADLLGNIDKLSPLGGGNQLVQAALDGRQRRHKVERQDHHNNGTKHTVGNRDTGGQNAATDAQHVEVGEEVVDLPQHLVEVEPGEGVLHIVLERRGKDRGDDRLQLFNKKRDLVGHHGDDGEHESREGAEHTRENGEDREAARPLVLLQERHQRVEPECDKQRCPDVGQDRGEFPHGGADGHGDNDAEAAKQAEAECVMDLQLAPLAGRLLLIGYLLCL